MSTSDLEKFIGGTQDKGVNLFEPDIGADIQWSEDTFNVTSGVRRGVGPRYGSAPLPGQGDTETNSATELNNIRNAEAATGNGLIRRRKCFAVVPVPYGNFSSPKTKSTHYIWIVGMLDIDDSNVNYIDISLNGDFDVANDDDSYSPDMTKGLTRAGASNIGFVNTELLSQVRLAADSDGTFRARCRALFEFDALKNYVPSAVISISGTQVPMHYLFGQTTTTGDIDTAPNINTVGGAIGGSLNTYCGVPSDFIYASFSTRPRLASVWTLTNSCDFNIAYSLANFTPTPFIYLSTYPTYGIQGGQTTIDLSTVVATKDSAGTTYMNSNFAVMYDSELITSSAHRAVLLALTKPVAILLQDYWRQSTQATVQTYADLSNPGLQPTSVGNQIWKNSAGTSSQNVATSFYQPPQYQDGAALSTSDTFGLGPADSGILRSDTTYDLTYSYYSKRFNYESNVGLPMRFQTGTDDFVSLEIFATVANGLTVFNIQSTFSQLLPYDFGSPQGTYAGMYVSGRGLPVNFTEIRFYYKEVGTTTWLSAGSYDAAEYWFKPLQVGGLRICSGPSGGLIGGEPSGFIDYSPIPNKQYNCTVIYKDRAFWFAEDAAYFSLRNNIFCYPTRNSIIIEGAVYRGGIVHIQPGQYLQTSRLVIFTTEASYVARFSGNPTTVPVRVSADTVGEYPLDGSDLTVDFLSEATAYSHRAACIAEGILYFWGPKGLYMDDGLNKPQKISAVLEPEIFNLVNQSLVGEVHCVYNARTKEVTWFYPPAVADAAYPTYSVIFNTFNQQLYFDRYKSKIDGSQTVALDSTAPVGVAGSRTMVFCRDTASDTIQRPFFFDDKCQSGEMKTGTELLVNEVSTPSPGVRRLTLAAGHVSTASISVGDYLGLIGVKNYATSLTTATDMIARITTVNTAYLDITLPDDGEISDGALVKATYFPIYQRTPIAVGLHGIAYRIDTNYWLPAGLSEAWSWLYLYFLFKYTGIPTPTNFLTGRPIGEQISLGYRTLESNGVITDMLSLQDNSDGHCQIHHPLRNVDLATRVGVAANGQALKYILSGIHIGDTWTLEYLEAHCKRIHGFTLKQFEG